LFSVNANGGPVCSLSPLPSQFTLMGTLNDNVPTYTGGLGTAVRARPMTLGGRDVLVVAAGSANTGALQIFFVDPSTGAVLDGTAIGTNSMPQPHISKVISLNGTQIGVRAMAMGDVNADGVPDIVAASDTHGVAFAFVGSVDANGILSYSGEIPFPAGPGQSLSYGGGVAMGDLDGVPSDEVAVADRGTKKQNGGVFIYHYGAGTFSLTHTISQPAGWVAIGDVTGDSSNDLVSCCASGAWVYPGPSFSNPVTISASNRVGVGNVTGGAYLNTILGNAGGATNAGVYNAPASTGELPVFTVAPLAGLSEAGSTIWTLATSMGTDWRTY